MEEYKYREVFEVTENNKIIHVHVIDWISFNLWREDKKVIDWLAACRSCLFGIHDNEAKNSTESIDCVKYSQNEICINKQDIYIKNNCIQYIIPGLENIARKYLKYKEKVLGKYTKSASKK